MPGRFASVEITRREIDDALSVPSEAIIPEMGRNLVYLYRSGRAQPVEIVSGIRTEARVQALSGIQAGDTLIVSGVMQLRTGTHVKIDQIR
jgi:membrane fusion protein (multidrug efflux system)